MVHAAVPASRLLLSLCSCLGVPQWWTVIGKWKPKTSLLSRFFFFFWIMVFITGIRSKLIQKQGSTQWLKSIVASRSDKQSKTFVPVSSTPQCVSPMYTPQRPFHFSSFIVTLKTVRRNISLKWNKENLEIPVHMTEQEAGLRNGYPLPPQCLYCWLGFLCNLREKSTLIASIFELLLSNLLYASGMTGSYVHGYARGRNCISLSLCLSRES